MKALIIGGNRFFGLQLARLLVAEGHTVTLLNRGNNDDGLGDKVDRICCNRIDQKAMKDQVEDCHWDVVFDQVCFDYDQAKSVCEVFEGKTNRVVFTSSMSVYDWGEEIQEDLFDPYSYTFRSKATQFSDYSEAKRQAEVAYFRYAKFPVTAVRLPIVFGQDDYTGRFAFHVEHILNDEPMFFPKLDAKLSLIRSDIAAELLFRLSIIEFEGPLNIACGDPLSLQEYMELIENNLNKKMILSEVAVEEATSPWGVPNHWTLSLAKARSLGLPTPNIKNAFVETLKTLNLPDIDPEL
ncbi:MAG: NAD-dependent epimerase/dehydratase family protein [Bdellovibrionales bacterium]